MIRPALTLALSLSLVLSACGPSGSSGPAASNTTAPQSPAGDAPLAGRTELEAAFAIAFPQGATVGKLTYQAKQLVPVSSEIEALIAEGSNQNDCHACTGKLRIVYLSRAGGGLAPVGKPGGWSIEGAGFGAPPQWSVDRTSGTSVLTVKTSYTNQGCTDITIDVYRLQPQGVQRDAAASKPRTESCEPTGDDNAMSNDQADTPAGVDTPAAQAAGANANWDAYYRAHPDQAPSPSQAPSNTSAAPDKQWP